MTVTVERADPPRVTSTIDREAQLARVVLELELALAKYSTTQGRIHLERALREARR